MEQVTVLMSTYNGKRFLKEQIESILNQSGVEVTLVIRDDGSSDGTKEILKEYGRLDNVKVLFGENEGPAMSFMSLVRGAEMETEYLAYADQDDIWLPEKLKEAVSAIGHRRERAVLYCSNQTVADEEGHGICLRYKEDPDHDHHKHRHDDRRGRQFLIIHRFKRIIHQMLHHIQRIVRIISGKKIDLAKYLEGVDQRHDRDEHDRRREIPDLDLPEDLALRSALQSCHFDLILRDAR